MFSDFRYPYHIFAATRVTDHQINTNNSTERGFSFYLTVYGCLAAGNSFFTLCRSFIFAYGGVVAAKTVQRQLLSKVLRVRSNISNIFIKDQIFLMF